MKNSIKILSIEAKDIYSAMQLAGNAKLGYNIRDKSGDILLRKFINTLDYSLDTIKLREVYEKATRRKNFSFIEGGKEYTQSVINVRFSYSYKAFNKTGQNIYVRAGYSLGDCVMSDGVCLKDNLLIAIDTGVEIKNPQPQDLLGKCFAYADGRYVKAGTIPVLMSKSDLRRYLYKNGFVCDGASYVRYKRSSGSGREGKCLFVLHTLADRMEKYDMCGLPVWEGDKIDLAAWEAYISLPMSSIIDTLEIRADEILVIEDYVSEFEDEVIAVDAPDGKLIANRKRAVIKNNIWDGESLLDAAMFEKYPGKGMLVLRNRFFKTCAFNTNIQQWFADNGIYEIGQLNGYTLAADISQIKLITTPSSIKYLKFGTLEQWFQNIDTVYGIVKHEKKTSLFGGRMVQAHYQLLNTLQMPRAEVESFLKPSLEYLESVRKDCDILRHHIGFAFRPVTDAFKTTVLKRKNDIVFKMLGVNNKFAQTKLYKDFRRSLIKGLVRNLLRGHVLVQGNYSTLFGNGLEMLKAAIGRFDGRRETEPGSIYCKHFKNGETVLASRSPHITMGNILLAKNIPNGVIDTYFNLSSEIVCVNAIGENIQQRLNGCDYDSDAVMLTNDAQLISTALKNYGRFHVPVNLVKSQKIERTYTAESKSDLDIITSVNKIGEIVNLSQYLNSLFWDRISKGAGIESCDMLYNDICKLAVLSGIEIDRAKKEIAINSAQEIALINDKYRMSENDKNIKPVFFKTIADENGYDVSDNVCYKQFDTTMDYLQEIVSMESLRQSRIHKSQTLPFMDIIKKPDMSNRCGYNSRQRDKILQAVKDANGYIQKLRIDYSSKDRAERKAIDENIAEIIQECSRSVKEFAVREYTLYLALKEIEKPENKDISNRLFEIMFQEPNEMFFTMVSNSREALYQLSECEDGDIRLYNYKYMKILSSGSPSPLQD